MNKHLQYIKDLHYFIARTIQDDTTTKYFPLELLQEIQISMEEHLNDNDITFRERLIRSLDEKIKNLRRNKK